MNRRLCQKWIHQVGDTDVGPCSDGKMRKSFPCVMEMAEHPRAQELRRLYKNAD